MVSQKDFGCRNLQFCEDDDLGGHVKTQNEPPGQPQRNNLSHRGAGTSYRVDVDLSTCVHGYLDSSATQRASLIVLEAQFAFVGQGPRRFRWADMSLKFVDDPSTPSKPDVISWAPFRFQEESDPTTIDVEEEKQGGGNISGGAGVVSGGANASVRKKSSYQMRYFDRGTAGRFPNVKNNTYDGVWWTLQESLDPKQRNGIRANSFFAVLIKRESDAPFIGDFQLIIEAGTWYSIRKAWETITCRAIPDDPINFLPSEPPQGKVTGIETNNLGKYTVKGELAKLVDYLNPPPSSQPPAAEAGGPTTQQ